MGLFMKRLNVLFVSFLLACSLSLPLSAMQKPTVPSGTVVINHYELLLFLKNNYHYDLCDEWFDCIEDGYRGQIKRKLRSIFESLIKNQKSTWKPGDLLSKLIKEIGLRPDSEYRPAQLNLVTCNNIPEKQKFSLTVDASTAGIIHGICQGLLSYLDTKYYYMRKKAGDQYIDSEPYMPLTLCYKDLESVQITGLPGACQHELFDQQIDYYRLFDMGPGQGKKLMVGLIALAGIFVPQVNTCQTMTECKSLKNKNQQ